jgi:hypothetical protein
MWRKTSVFRSLQHCRGHPLPPPRYLVAYGRFVIADGEFTCSHLALSHVFLLERPLGGYRPIYILPAPGYRGSHVLVSNGEEVFDYHGYSGHDRYVTRHFARVRRLFPG